MKILSVCTLRAAVPAPACSPVAIYRDAGARFQRNAFPLSGSTAETCPFGCFSIHSFTTLVNGIACRMSIPVPGGKLFRADRFPHFRIDRRKAGIAVGACEHMGNV